MTEEEFINQLKEKVEAVYKENVDIQPDKIILYFPEITITNSLKHSHLIKNLYYVLCYDIEDDKFKKVYHFLYRETMTNSEKNSSYMFSHYQIEELTKLEGKFCFGSTALSVVHNKIETGLDLNENSVEILTGYLIGLKYYFNYESLEGGPYKRISDLKSSITYKRIPADYFDYPINRELVVPKLTIREPLLTGLTDQNLMYKIFNKDLGLIPDVHCEGVVHNGEVCSIKIDSSSQNTYPHYINLKRTFSFKNKRKTKIIIIPDKVENEKIVYTHYNSAFYDLLSSIYYKLEKAAKFKVHNELKEKSKNFNFIKNYYDNI